MVIGWCGRVPRNTGIDPDAMAQTWRDRVHLQAHGLAAAEARRLAAGADRDSRMDAKLPKSERGCRLAPASPSHAAEFSVAASSNAPSHMRSIIRGGESHW